MSNQRVKKKPLKLTNTKVEGTVKATMAGWKQAQRKSLGRRSSTPGRTKGSNCQASGLDRYMAKSGRSYKHPLYEAWTRRKTGLKG